MNPQDPSNPVPNPPVSPAQPYDADPQVVYMSRPIEPQRQQMSPEIMEKHEQSKRMYPKLNLSPGEYIISAMKRHPIGLISIWSVTAFVIITLMVVAIVFSSATADDTLGTPTFPVMYLMIPAILISMLALLFGFISTFIYNANRFYLTNESVIQHIQLSLFNQREQTISLANVEDASFSQDGILPHLFDYGLLRLSTQGDETTYRFSYASQPQKQIAQLNNAVEAFKNVRPIEH